MAKHFANLERHLPRAPLRLVAWHYLASVAVYGFLLLVVTYNPWFHTLLSISYRGITAAQCYVGMFVAYVLLAPVCLAIGRPRSLWISKNLAILRWLARVVRLATGTARRGARPRWRPRDREKQALMFLLIKLIFGPLMLYSAFFELGNLSGLWFRLNFQATRLDALDIWYLMFVSGIFLVDSSTFFIGYTTEAGFLGNRLRYAETNMFRIVVCIACYAPFNLVTTTIFGPSNYEVGILFRGELDHPMTWILRGVAACALLVLISSTLSLFTKASNLTNRGIVTYGPYALVRHPGYVAKNLFWLTTCVPLWFPDWQVPDFSWSAHVLEAGKVLLGVLAWGSLYFLRSITEEQFLRQDPDYVAYCRRVRYRFLPGIC